MARSVSGEVQPGLGVSWSHVPRTRILLERVHKAAAVSPSSLRSATLIKSSRQVRRIRGPRAVQYRFQGQKGFAEEETKFFSAPSKVQFDEEAPYFYLEAA